MENLEKNRAEMMEIMNLLKQQEDTQLFNIQVSEIRNIINYTRFLEKENENLVANLKNSAKNEELYLRANKANQRIKEQNRENDLKIIMHLN